jgi:hypothetical protein
MKYLPCIYMPKFVLLSYLVIQYIHNHFASFWRSLVGDYSEVGSSAPPPPKVWHYYQNLTFS